MNLEPSLRRIANAGLAEGIALLEVELTSAKADLFNSGHSSLATRVALEARTAVLESVLERLKAIHDRETTLP